MTPDQFHALAKPKRHKYGAIKTIADGVTFDSKKEARRYGDLKNLERAGKITKLELQPSFDITINGVHVCKVKLDFSYFDKEKGCWVWEDVKGGAITRTPVSRLKHKLLFATEGIKVTYV